MLDSRPRLSDSVVVGEVAQILGDALVGVVGADRRAVGGQADAVIGAVGQPFGQELRRSASGASGSAATGSGRLQ